MRLRETAFRPLLIRGRVRSLNQWLLGGLHRSASWTGGAWAFAAGKPGGTRRQTPIAPAALRSPVFRVQDQDGSLALGCPHRK